MESYIIRVYRRGNSTENSFVGTIEDVARQEIRTFHSVQELERALKLEIHHNGRSQPNTEGKS